MDKDRIVGSAKDVAGEVEGDAKTETAGRIREGTGCAQTLYGQAKHAARVSDDNPRPPFVFDGLDPAPEPKSTIAEASEVMKGTVSRVSV